MLDQIRQVRPRLRMFTALAILAAMASVGAQSGSSPSPFAGLWAASVPGPDGGQPVPFLIVLSVEGQRVTGTLKIGRAEAVEIEDARIRGDVLSFRRTLSDDGSRIQFLARIIDDGLRVGFMQRGPADAPAGGGSGQVVNFTAKRVRGH